jgi:hypothetical protein
MRRIPVRLTVLCATFAGVLAFGATAAQATSGAHFMNDTSASVGTTASDLGVLNINIDEAGLGNALVNYTLTWNGTADYGCINGGGNHPQASNKETTGSGGAQSFSEQPKNGRVQVTVPIDGTPPPAPSTFSCPSGQTLVLADVSYTATLADTTNGVSITLHASHTFFTFKK